MNENLKTLREVCALVGTTRSAVQGYEQLGIVKATAVNKYGHLLYGEKAVERIALIYYLQKLNFRLKEIRDLLSLSQNELNRAIARRITLLKNEAKVYGEFLEYSELLFSDLTECHIESKILELLKKEI